MKIVSLLPSATELVCALGLQDHLVGVSHECDYPVGVESLPRVTTTRIGKGLSSAAIDAQVREHLDQEAALYSLDMDQLETLSPDLIVTQALCDVCAVAATEVDAAACHLPGQPRVINLEPMSLDDVLRTLTLLARETGCEREADSVLTSLRERIRSVRERSAQLSAPQRPRVAFLEWIDPLFNGGHWTPELIHMAGGQDCFGNPNKASETIVPEAILQADPDVLFVALCGFDMARTRQDLDILADLPGWQELRCVREGQLYFTDGNAYFSRPGPRLVDSLEILAHCLHPDLHPLPAKLQPAENFSDQLAG